MLYDGSCGFCRRWVPYWQNTLKKRGFEIALLQSDWVVEKLKVSEEDLLYDLRLLFADGKQMRGAEAYRYLMKRIWWAKPLYFLSTLPGLRTLFDAGYRAFADHRHRISRLCGLQQAEKGRRHP